jgi:hypothetical protein
VQHKVGLEFMRQGRYRFFAMDRLLLASKVPDIMLSSGSKASQKGCHCQAEGLSYLHVEYEL